MLADWSVECAEDDPILVVPWHSASQASASDASAPDAHAARFIDLREDPYALDQIPEAELYPPLMQALRALNAQRSPVFTAKCDAWPLASEELDDLCTQLDPPAPRANDLTGFASYIDILWRDRSIFTSFHQHEQLLHRLSRLAAPIDQSWAMLDCVLRPALLDLTGPQEGFAISLYVKALGDDRQSARAIWAEALDLVVSLIRSKDIALA